MTLKGMVRDSELRERPVGSDFVELAIKVQGVGPDQPRTLIVPFEMLLENPELGPDEVKGRSFAAEAELDEEGRWVVTALTLAGRKLREE